MTEFPLTPAECIGKVAHYRLPFEKEMKSSTVMRLRRFRNLEGKMLSLLVMENEDEIAASACYFQLVEEQDGDTIPIPKFKLREFEATMLNAAHTIGIVLDGEAGRDRLEPFQLQLISHGAFLKHYTYGIMAGG